MKVALVGNQNCGKTSLFNKLTRSNQKVGNWPGVTIERKEGVIEGTNIELIDLPGVYSLLPYTSEEDVTRDYLFNSPPDVIVNVVDATALERSLYLSTQLMELGLPVVLALNMIDILDKRKWILDERKLSKDLGLPVVKISAKTGLGFAELVAQVKKQKTQKTEINTKKYSNIIENTIKNTKKSLKLKNDFIAIEQIISPLEQKDEGFLHDREILCKLCDVDLELVFASERYKFISRVVEGCFSRGREKEGITEKLDRVLLNKYLAIPIFVCVMSLMYFLSVGFVGKLTAGWISHLFEIMSDAMRRYLSTLGVSSWLVSLIVDGILTGVGSVLSFLPQLIVIFLIINLLETTGYMSRIAFVFDKIFYKFGLSGKVLISFIIGSGCSVPAISATRAIEKQDEKQKAIILAPFIPCSAKLPIISLFISAFFPTHSGIVVASLYFLAVLLILLSAVILNKFFFKQRESSFVSELPEYKLPSIKSIVKDVFNKSNEFVIRAGTIIVFCSILIWFLSSFSLNLRFCENVESSILAKLGGCFAWFFYPIIGELNWAASVSAIQGLVAKEQVVSSMSIISGLAETGVSGSMFLSGVFSGFNKISAYSFVVFNLFSAPCLASIGAMKNEFKSVKKTIFAVCFQIGLAWLASSIIYQIGRLFI